MNWEALIVALMLVVMMIALASGRIGVDLIVLGVLTVLILAGVVTPGEAVAGYANTGLLTIAFLYILTAGLRETGAMTMLTRWLIGRPKSVIQAQAKLVLPVTFMSAFANNTPIVASFLPIIHSISRQTGIAASKLYMPLSFAAILGGIGTLIGTSTNLVVAGQIIEHNKRNPDLPPIPEFGMFTISLVGLPIAIVGIIYILLLGRKLLPDSQAQQTDPDSARQYMTAMKVAPASPIIGKTLEQAGLRHLPGLFLSRIDRMDKTIVAVSPHEKLEEGDVLVFVGLLSSVIDLQKMKGIVPVADGAPDQYRPKMRLIEAVVSNSSPLIGRSIRESGIRTRYGAVVVAVHRQGHHLRGKVGEIVLRPGDTLLLETAPGFAQRYGDSREFHLVSELEGSAAPRHERAWISLLILLMVVITISTGMLEPLTASMLAAGLTVLLRCCTGPEARASLDWQVLAVIGGAFGIGRAMEQSGLADIIAHSIIGWAAPLGPAVLLAVIYIVTLVFTMFITNNAAAILVFPIAYSAASEANLNFLPFAICIAVAASAEFSTPIGYQTNLMVMGPGGYKFKDFIRFGGPLTLLSAIVAIILCSFAYGPLS